MTDTGRTAALKSQVAAPAAAALTLISPDPHPPAPPFSPALTAWIAAHPASVPPPELRNSTPELDAAWLAVADQGDAATADRFRLRRYDAALEAATARLSLPRAGVPEPGPGVPAEAALVRARFQADVNAERACEGIPVSRADRKRAFAVLPGGLQ
jgi:hypothetical protein